MFVASWMIHVLSSGRIMESGSKDAYAEEHEKKWVRGADFGGRRHRSGSARANPPGA